MWAGAPPVERVREPNCFHRRPQYDGAKGSMTVSLCPTNSRKPAEPTPTKLLRTLENLTKRICGILPEQEP